MFLKVAGHHIVQLLGLLKRILMVHTLNGSCSFSSQLHFSPSLIPSVCIYFGCLQVAQLQHLSKCSTGWMLLPES